MSDGTSDVHLVDLNKGATDTKILGGSADPYPHDFGRPVDGIERNPSFSANCNILMALLHVQNLENYASQISKAAMFLCDVWSEEEVKDKWVSKMSLN